MKDPADLAVVRESYDRVADNYVAMGMGDLGLTPWLRAALTAFAEEVRDLGPVLDVGCGPGTVTAFLAGLGIDASGVDLAPDGRARAPAASRAAVRGGVGHRTGSGRGLARRRARLVVAVQPAARRAARRSGVVRPGTRARWAGAPRHPRRGRRVPAQQAYGGVPVGWTTYLWQPDQLVALLAEAALEPVAELRLPPPVPGQRRQVLLAARRPG